MKKLKKYLKFLSEKAAPVKDPKVVPKPSAPPRPKRPAEPDPSWTETPLPNKNPGIKAEEELSNKVADRLRKSLKESDDDIENYIK